MSISSADKEALLEQLRAAAAAGLGADEQLINPDELCDEGATDYSDPDWPMRAFARDFKSLGAPCIDIIDAKDMTPMLFLREYVSKNRPVVIDNALQHWGWPAFTKWARSDYLKKVAGAEKITVDFTPDGRGDCIVEDRLFVTPVEEKMHFRDFIDLLDETATEAGAAAAVKAETIAARAAACAAATGAAPDVPAPVGPVSARPEGVPYCQHQNSSFSTEFAVLHQDAALSLPFANEAFGEEPEAVNFWMGDGRATSSMHSDPYENLYCVVRGAKHFTLLPPGDEYWLSRRTVPKAHWVRGPPPADAPAHPLYVATAERTARRTARHAAKAAGAAAGTTAAKTAANAGVADDDDDDEEEEDDADDTERIIDQETVNAAIQRAQELAAAQAQADTEAAAASAASAPEGSAAAAVAAAAADADAPEPESAAAAALRRRAAARQARAAAAAASGVAAPVLDLEDVPMDVPAVVGRFHTVVDYTDAPVDADAAVGADAGVDGDADPKKKKQGPPMMVPWLEVDVDRPRKGDRLRVDFSALSKFNVTVRAGQALYLPGQWFHAVRQEGVTIAVNYWYGMQYDVRFLYTELIKGLKEQKDRRRTGGDAAADEAEAQ